MDFSHMAGKVADLQGRHEHGINAVANGSADELSETDAEVRIPVSVLNRAS